MLVIFPQSVVDYEPVLVELLAAPVPLVVLPVPIVGASALLPCGTFTMLLVLVLLESTAKFLTDIDGAHDNCQINYILTTI